MSDTDALDSPAKSRSSTHKRKARRGQLLHLIWILALLLGSLWWFCSAKYHAASIAALEIEQHLPAGLVADVATPTEVAAQMASAWPEVDRAATESLHTWWAGRLRRSAGRRLRPRSPRGWHKFPAPGRGARPFGR